MSAPDSLYWTPPESWTGHDAFIIGGGPSLRGFDFKRLTGHLTIGCNSAFTLGADVCKIVLFSDKKFFEQVIDGKPVYEHLKLYPSFVVATLLSLRIHPWLKIMDRSTHTGLETRKHSLTFDGCSGGSAINLALHMGARRVFLLGFDCKSDFKTLNWHDNIRIAAHKDLYAKFIRGFENIAASLPATFPGREIINLGPDSELTCFPFMSIDSILTK